MVPQPVHSSACGDRFMSSSHRGFVPTRSRITAAMIAIAALSALLPAAPACAHHGKDFLLTATDDMPLRGHLYTLLSVDDTIESASGHRSIEITPGVLFAVTDRFSLEPHVHIARDEE